ncbi:hypothetical protein EHE19_001670 [Ruminiclostridium herbifermentans]|uniref:Uncharacterized protein n=1 Tax=Ruminiclostridium herbifermentans TaxID=2488810 RepID=A0A7H1VPG8_9FIRM|nr:hypothetical protein EHE19_001670 [Ruminiclostridium herbifermentans]
MVIKSNVLRFYWSNILLFVVSVFITIILFKNNCFKIDQNKVIDLTNYNAVIAGFLFTALSILISALSNERIARLKKYHYIDKYFAAIIIALILSISALIFNFMYLFFTIKFITDHIIIFQKIVVAESFVSSIFFIQGVYYVIKTLKKY